jgi:DNA primase
MSTDAEVERVKAAADIVAIISQYVHLRRAGREYVGPCPFHKEQTPSFTVNPAGRFYHCFGCQAHGDVIRFIMEHERLRFPDALRKVADLAGVTLQRSGTSRPVMAPLPPARPPEPAAVEIAPALPDLAERLAEFQRALPGSPAQQYLESRGISLELAVRYGLGFAAYGKWPHLKDGKPVMQWRPGRVVFPQADPSGRVVNLYGRAIVRPGGECGVKHAFLPGAKGYFNTAALAHGDGPLFVTEGAFDALALIAAGIPRTVAIFGLSNLRWPWLAGVRSIVVAFDADRAGINGKARLIADCWGRGVTVLHLDARHFGGAKDASEAWAAGSLRVSAV